MTTSTSMISTMQMYPISSANNSVPSAAQSASATVQPPSTSGNTTTVSDPSKVAQSAQVAAASGTGVVSQSDSVQNEKVSISSTGVAKAYTENGLASTSQVVDPTALSQLRQSLVSDANYQAILQQVTAIDEMLKLMEGTQGVGNSLSSLSGAAANMPGMTQIESMAYSVFSAGTTQKDVERWLNSEVIRDPQLAASLQDKKTTYTFQQQWLVQLKDAMKTTGEFADKLANLDEKKTSKEEAASTFKAFMSEYNAFRSKAAADMESAGKERSDTLKVNQGYFAMQRDTEKWFYSRGDYRSLEDLGISTNEKTGVLSFDEDKFNAAFDNNPDAARSLLNEFGDEYMNTVEVYGSDTGPVQARIDNIQQGLDWLKTNAPALQNVENATTTQNSATRSKMAMYANVSYMG